MPPADIMSPIRIKNGTAIREKEFKPLTDCWATVISGTFKYNKVNNVEIPIEKMI